MTGATVRSVRVVMEADVAGYEARMKSAGRVTEQSFAGAQRQVKATDQQLNTIEVSYRKVDRAEKAVTETTTKMNVSLANTERTLKANNSQLDTFSGRAGILIKLAAGFGPALLPISAVGVPAVAGLASQLGFATAAGGSAILALQGVGDALTAIEKARLEPTVANVEAADVAVRHLAPAAQELVHHLEDLRDTGRQLQQTAAGGFIPGLDDSLTALESRIPVVRRRLFEISDAAGDAVRDGGESIASSRWDSFFEYLGSEARPQIDGIADSVGNMVHGFAELFVATTPLQRDFTSWLREGTEDFDTWATRLSSSSEFAEFVQYARENGPQVEETFASIANAILQIVEATAPLGGPALQVLESVADTIAAISGSDAGTALVGLVSALSTYSLVAGGVQKINKTTWGSQAVADVKGFGSALTTVTTAQDRAQMSTARLAAIEEKRGKAIGAGLRTLGRGAAVAGGLAVATTGVADSMGLANTATLGLMGTVAGPWGAAIGAGVGLLLDWRANSAGASESAAEFTGTLDTQTGALTDNSRALAVQKLEEAGALDSARQLGLNLALVTDAALGNEAAQTRLTSALAGYDEQVISSTTGRGASVVGYNEEAAAALNLQDAVSDVAGAVGTSREEFHEQADAMGDSSRATNDLRQAYEATATAADHLTSELTELDGFLSKRGAARAYQASIDDLRKSLKDAPRAWSEFTDAGRTNLANLDQIVSTAAEYVEQIADPKRKARFLDDVIAQLRDIGKQSPEAAAAVRDVLPALKEVRNANKELVIRADSADAMKKAKIAELALRELNTLKPRPVVTVDPGNSFSILGMIRNQLAGIKSKTVTVTVNRGAGVRTDIPVPGGQAGADGMTVAGQRLPYGDKVLAYLAPGEEVISNRYGQADRFRADRAAGRIPGYADGGTAGGDTATGKPDPKDPKNKKNESALVSFAVAALLASDSLRELKQSSKELTKSEERLRTSRDALQARYDEISSRTVSMFTSDLFAESEGSNNPWTAGGKAGVDPLAVLQGDIADLTKFEQLKAQLEARGLTGDALDAAAQGGVKGLQVIANYSDDQLAQFSALLGIRSSMATAAGSGLADAVVGPELRSQTAELKGIRKDLKELQEAIEIADSGNREGHRARANQGAGAGDSGFVKGKDDAAGRGRRRARRTSTS